MSRYYQNLAPPELLRLERIDDVAEEDGAPNPAEQVVAHTALLLSGRGDFESAALLGQVDAAAYEFIDGYVVDATNWRAQARALVVEVPDAVLAAFTDEVLGRIYPVASALAERAGEHAVTEVQARPTLPPVDADWRQTVTDTAVSNQAPRERAAGGPEADGLVFSNTFELAVYRALVRFQLDAPEENTIAIAPLPGVRLRAGHTWHPDFLVAGRGRAVVIECDGPLHRNRRAADHTRDWQFERCGLPTVRIPVELTQDASQLNGLLREHLRRHLGK